MELPKRNPNRISGFDYSQNGAYFITICTQNRQRILSKIVGTPVPGCPQVPCPELLSYGKIADKYIRQMNTFYDHLSVDKYVIMPDHIHVMIRLDNGSMWASTPTGAKKQHNRVSNIVRSIKVLVAKEIGESIFHRSYYDNVIRNQQDYDEIWQYIENNPRKWLIERQEYKYSSFCRERCPHCSTVQESRFLNAFSDRILSRKYVKKDAVWLVA